MDKKAFAEIEARLLEVNKVVEKLDSSIRVAAFEFLKPYIAGGAIRPPKALHEPDDETHPANGGLEAMVEKFGSDDKPSENAKLLSAWWFSQHGSAPFSTKWIKEMEDSTGLTLPAKPDMTFRQAKKKGKAFYKSLGKGGLFKPTIVGERFLKTTYKVKKGTKASPGESK